MFAADVLKVLYAPHKAFKTIVENPKYWGPLLVFILVVALQSGFYFAQSQQIYYEQTYPSSSTNLADWTTNSTIWAVSPGVAIANDTQDYLNSTYYGSSSLQFSATNTTYVGVGIPSFPSVNCSVDNFQNFSARVKQVEPAALPSKVTLTLYSLSEANYYTFDLTSQFSNASQLGLWTNITVPVGANAAGWQSSGNPTWGNVTGLKFEFTYPSDSNVTLRMTGLFFRGEYRTFLQISATGLVITVLQQSLFQFIFEWLFLSGIMYIVIKGLKGTVTWKPLFVVVGFVLIVTAIQAAISIAAVQALPIIHSPIELQAGLLGEAETISAAIATQTSTYSIITGVVQLITYAWIVGLGGLGIRALQPEMTMAKSILASAAALVVTIILMSLLGV